jgi:large subunit ribosomal protein L24
MSTKFRIKAGDTVKVIAGDSKGKTGLVKVVLKEKNAVIVEGLNIVKRHIKPSASNPNGSIVEKEAAIHISNVAYFDAATNQTTKIGRKLDSKGKLARYSKKTDNFVK